MSALPETPFPVWKKAALALLVWLATAWLLYGWVGDWAYMILLLFLIFVSLNSRTLWIWEVLATLTLFGLICEF